MSTGRDTRVRFGAFDLDVNARELRAGTRRVRLRFVATEDADEPAPGRAEPHRIRIAVLPFIELGEGLQHDYFGHAFTDEMISQLGRRCHGRLGVISSHSSMAFRNTAATAHEIGTALRADYLLEGSIRHNGGRVRITARLI